MAFEVGDLELGEPLGHGGQATVRRARDSRTGEVAAAKILEPRVWHDPRLRRRLERELGVLQRVEHPAVVRVIGTRELDGRGVLLMELLEGGTLADMIREGPLPPVRALAILTDVAAGLDAAHHLGIVHRDVTASNVLLRPDGSAVLADFGLALGPDDAPTTTDGLTCTPAYVAPEVASGSAPSPAADRYAFAVVAFEALTGRRPFEAPTPVGLLHAHVTDEPPAASEVAAGLPRSADGPLRAGLAKDPSSRPRSSGDLVARLADGLSTTPRSRRSSAGGGGWGSRRRRAAVGVSVLLLLAGGAIAIGPGIGLPWGSSGPAAGIPASVPGPDGGPRRAVSYDSGGVSGVGSGIPAAAATVAGVEVVALDGEPDAIAGQIRDAEADEGADIGWIERDGRAVAEIARRGDGTATGVVQVGRPPTTRTLVLRGGPGAVETYVAALVAAMPGRVSAPTESGA